MLVYVRNQNGNPLMPCKPAKARKLLRAGKAKVVNRCPFTLQLLWDCEENVQGVTVGIDKGSHVTGFCAVAAKRGEILMSGEIHHRRDIKEKMENRRVNRRNRRNRKWYRKERFLNRASSKRSGRLPPSIKANVEEVIRVVQKIPLPISRVVIEDVQVDIARLNNPDLVGKAYQQSNRLDENLSLATLIRDHLTCQCCQAQHVPLEAHHIVWRENQGKDSISNLITVCRKCHRHIHKTGKSGEVLLKTGEMVRGMSGKLDPRFAAQRTMVGKAYLYETLGQMARVEKVFGYQTSAYRKSLNLPKSHDIDALCVATLETGEAKRHARHNFYTIGFRHRQTRRQYHDLPRPFIGRVRYQVNAQLAGFRKGDVVRVKGKWVKQINSIYSSGYLAFARVKGEPNAAKPKDCQLLVRGQTVIWGKAS